MVDVDQMLVQGSHVIAVHANPTVVVQERKGVLVAGAEDERVRGDGGSVLQDEPLSVYALQTCHFREVPWQRALQPNRFEAR